MDCVVEGGEAKRSGRPAGSSSHRSPTTPQPHSVPLSTIVAVAFITLLLLTLTLLPSPATRWQRATAASVARCASDPAALAAATAARFAAARDLLVAALPDDAVPPVNTTLRAAFIQAAVVQGVTAVDAAPSIHTVYARVWKAANEAVRANVAASYGPLDEYDEVPPVSRVPPNGTCYFAFVRDPVPRLLSGYNEGA